MAEEFYNHEWERKKDDMVLRIDFPKECEKISNAILNNEKIVEIEEGNNLLQISENTLRV